MKIVLLAALAVAAPAFAQTAPSADPAMQAPQTTGDTMTMPAPATPDTPATPATSSDPAMPAADSPAGGYGPSGTTLVVPPGATIRYQQAPTPDQAYPAPAPMTKYPTCKKGQYDNCVERRSPK